MFRTYPARCGSWGGGVSSQTAHHISATRFALKLARNSLPVSEQKHSSGEEDAREDKFSERQIRGDEKDFLLLDCRAEACTKGVFFRRRRYQKSRPSSRMPSRFPVRTEGEQVQGVLQGCCDLRVGGGLPNLSRLRLLRHACNYITQLATLSHLATLPTPTVPGGLQHMHRCVFQRAHLRRTLQSVQLWAPPPPRFLSSRWRRMQPETQTQVGWRRGCVRMRARSCRGLTRSFWGLFQITAETEQTSCWRSSRSHECR